MRNDIVKRIDIMGNEVFLTASGDPGLSYDIEITWECEQLSEILAQNGKDALYARIGEDLWKEELYLEQGNTLCNLFTRARAAFPSDMDYRSFDPQLAGNLLGEMVSKLEDDPLADLSGYVARALHIRNDRDYILGAAKRKGWNYLNYAHKSLQRDRLFSLEVLKAGGANPWFEYPKQFAEDKPFALQALQINGCFYRELGDHLKVDREIILAAFQEKPEREYHEFLPDLIPKEALYKETSLDSPLELDKPFIFELLDCCPSIHLSRAPELLRDRDIAMKWVQVGKFFPHRVTDLPDKYLNDKEFQEVLIHRFQNTDQYEYLLQNFSIMGIPITNKSLDTKIESASSRVGKPQPDSDLKVKQSAFEH